MAKQAFLIQSIGPTDSEVRLRADKRMSEIIQPACDRAGYNCVRADSFPRETIIEPIVSALATSPLVIADLGDIPWNSNVLMEIGFRIATGKPIVFLSEVEPTPDRIPLHVQNRRIIQYGETEPTINRLAQLITESPIDTGFGWRNQYPTIDFQVPLKNPEKSVFTYANQEAAEFYGFETADDLLASSVEEADKKLMSYMDTEQATQFHDEQVFLFGKALVGETAVASVPAWFTKHKNSRLNRRPFWPALLSRKFSSKPDECLVMRVAFFDLAEWSGPGQPSLGRIVKLPDQLRPRKFRNDIFLSYNSRDAEFVRGLKAVLESFGLMVWHDETNLVGRSGLTAELMTAISESRIFCTVLGNSGLGEWQEDELLGEIRSIRQNGRPFAVLLHPDMQEENGAWLEVLPTNLRNLFADRLYATLPPLAGLQVAGDSSRFFARLMKLFAASFRESDI